MNKTTKPSLRAQRSNPVSYAATKPLDRFALLAMTIALTLTCTGLQAADRDPTRPIAYKAPAKASEQSGLKLQSLLISKQRRQATINGKQVEEGDRIAGAKIIAIGPHGVTVERAGKRQQLKLHTTVVKRAPSRDAK